MGVLRLQLPTDPRWVNIVKKTLKKSDGSCFVNKGCYKCNYNHHSQFRTSRFSAGFIGLAKEEIDHFEQVHNIIVKRA
jgi:tRNA-(ms[2]io[6]A)-hydroxylase